VLVLSVFRAVLGCSVPNLFFGLFAVSPRTARRRTLERSEDEPLGFNPVLHLVSGSAQSPLTRRIPAMISPHVHG
jgi:hypothetical protein